MRSSQVAYSADVIEYGFEEEEERPKYKFRAICTSDECRTKNRASSERTDVGIVKKVDKKADYCPHCTNALFWERYIK